MIELILAEDLTNIAKTGDSVILKNDGTFEIKKSDLEKDQHISPENLTETERQERETAYQDYKRRSKKSDDITEKAFDPRIEKYLSIDDRTAWQLLTKFYENGHLPAYKVLKSFINKTAQCPDISEKFDDIMVKWMTEGEVDTSSIEKIINSCKKEGGNIDKTHKLDVDQDDEPVKIRPIGKTGEHSTKMKRCLEEVDTEGGKYNKYAVCGASIGKSVEIINDVIKESIRERVNQETKEPKKETPEEARSREKRYQQEYFREM